MLSVPTSQVVDLPVRLPSRMEFVRPSLAHAPRWVSLAQDPMVLDRMNLSGSTPRLFREDVWATTRYPVLKEDMGADGWGVVDLAIQEVGTHQLAGSFRLHNETPAAHPGVGVEYALCADYRGRGLASQVVPSALEWALTVFEPAHLFAECDDDNVPSQQVLKRSGLRQVAPHQWCSCG